MSMNIKEVQYTQYHGGGNIDAWIAEAWRTAGLPHNHHWLKRYSMRRTATAVSLSVLAGVSALSQHKSRRRVSRAPGILATALLCATALSQPNLAYAGPHGGGGFHGDHDRRFDGDHDRTFDGDHDRRFDRDRFRRGGFFGGFYADPRWRYYCSAPAGYYPYVTQCNIGWQTVPAS
jgi:hypothetical protein